MLGPRARDGWIIGYQGVTLLLNDWEGSEERGGGTLKLSDLREVLVVLSRTWLELRDFKLGGCTSNGEG